MKLSWVAAKPLRILIVSGVTTPWLLSPPLIPFSLHEPAQFKVIHNIRSTVPSEEWERAFFSETPSRGDLLPRGTSHHLETTVLELGYDAMMC
jgi:hypothetical protein